MGDKVKCAWCARKLPPYLEGGLTEDARAEIRRHLLACPDCRGELGGYFPLDRWAEDALPAQDIPAGFTAAVMARLLDYQSAGAGGRTNVSAPPAGKAGGFARRALLGNYLVAAAATMILVFTNAFGIFTGLAARADQLNAGARDLTIQTQRLVEAPPRWLDLLKLHFKGDHQSHEGGIKHAQE